MHRASGTSSPRGRGSAERLARQPASRSVYARFFRFSAGLACLIVIVAFLFGYASPYLPPDSFWWSSLLAAVLPYLAVLALLTALVARVAFGRRWTLPLVLVAVLVLVRFFPVARLTAPSIEPSGDDLVVMSYNAPVRGPDPETLARTTLQLIQQVEPDLLALQEPAIWIQEKEKKRRATAHIQAVIDSLDYWAPMPGGEGSQFTILQPVLARFSLGRTSRYAFSSYHGSSSPTYVTRVPFTWKGQDAVLYNVHLHTTGARKPWHEPANLLRPAVWIDYMRQYRDSYMRRTSEARQLRTLIQREAVPVIIAGDFNSTVHGWELRHIMKGLTDVFTARGKGWGGTYHARLPIFRIDHILVSPEWEIVSAHVPDMLTLSDHRPVVARLRWRQN